MTLEECYRALGGSYSEVLARLIDDKMITKISQQVHRGHKLQGYFRRT